MGYNRTKIIKINIISIKIIHFVEIDVGMAESSTSIRAKISIIDC
jgi:hypothetical protein